MYIKSIVLDGFKSYGHRTEITDFDPMFNAITGLNGTGKSNILDAICFVLGISNLSQVRAKNLQELIYKNGQAGVDRASVSILFDNRDSNQCPPGLENMHEFTITRQVSMGNKNKYLLNGTTVQPKRIQDLFCSVQLNVNNPHFLIMQGRITKVLNMKAPEILSMMEEAAGTRMYEIKRQTATATIQKKDAKLKELNKLIQEEIAPKLAKLREERNAFLEYQQLERDIEHMDGLYIAWQFYVTQQNTVVAEAALGTQMAQIDDIKQNIANNKHEIAAIDSEVDEIQRKDKSTHDRFAEIEADVKAKEKIEAKASAAEKSALENITIEEREKNKLEKNLNDDRKTLEAKERELARMQEMFQQLKDADATDAEALAAAQKRFEAISAGMEIGEDGEAVTLQEQVMVFKQKAAEAKTEIQQASMQLDHCKKQLNEKQREVGTSVGDYQELKKQSDTTEKELQQLQKRLSGIKYDENQLRSLQDTKRKLTTECYALKEEIDLFQAQYPQTDFSYTDPEPNFNRRSVHGLVCNLIKLQTREVATAIETAAGGRLYNVIVSNDVTSKKLLQRGNLQRRTTFIPLNKIQSGKMSADVIKCAQDLVGADNVQPALSLIRFGRELQPAMEFIFGNVFVCRDINVGRQVAFHNRIKRKCVTLDGDVINPAGTLSGGAVRKEESILLLLENVTALQEQLQEKQRQFAKIESDLSAMTKNAEAYNTVRQRLDILTHQHDLINRKLQLTTHHQHQEEISTLKKSVSELTEKIAACKLTETANNKKADELSNRMKNAKGERERRLKEAEAEVKRLKKRAERSGGQWKQKEQEYESLKLEISELGKELESTGQRIEKCLSNLVSLKEQYEGVKNEHEEAKRIAMEAQSVLKEHKVIMAEKNKAVQKQVQRKEALLAQISEFQLEIQRQMHQVAELEGRVKDLKTQESAFRKSVKQNSKYLEEAQKLTEQEGRDLQGRVHQAKEKKQKLSRTVNTKAQSMFDQEEKTFQRLVKKKGVVEANKRKIIEVIEDLDKKKKETLMLAWQQVSKDFGSIFGTLLPGSNCALKPPEGKTILDGLEIKVSLGGIWKENLSELSGGQKSLIALSLILAMLLFKPAPIYILDEVDAALDLSHTQNIGSMLKSHFKHSQFIIVSLKNGMFNNANILFQTKLIDGISAITRTVNR